MDEEENDFWDRFDSQLDALQCDPDAWAVIQAENAEFDGTLLDGLPDDDGRRE